MRKGQTPALKRVIVDFKKLDKHMLNLLVEKFPDGYDDDDIVTYRNANNEVVECVEVRTEDTAYLVKVSKRLVMAMEDFDDSDNDSEDESDLNTDELEGSEEE
ncbi:MAG: hypothetical protein ACE37L_04125 [Allomuricauda sp.]|jgi:hypothetical protein|uniref:DNA primase n=1 Tax=Flagellimonas sp. MMG031 TaxID=3158549 RepID=A0AAU7MVZ5_9FLAO|nr:MULTISPECIES: hypothetical protein [unclassified Allomuricauda]MBO6532075.1 hypothetical protein [Allomuricauda sp.]MBO6588906.1 hypothetical protein [Allomuricauda sp.]MBO6618531.1 hypothetical protein [Allomuricauda sp.]MBO6644444.1 hypothetical protein [Allomuricauda sp.]MBO6746344.1 hypothetical protein [Allomuricauda sp.]